MPHALNLDNLPTPKDEVWKFTNLPRALPANLTVADAPYDIVIHKTSGQNGGKIEDISIDARDGQHVQPCLKIVIEDNAEATIVERQGGEGAYWKNMTTEITLGQNAKLHHIRINQDSAQGVQTNMVHMNVARDAVYNGFSLNMGGRLTRHDIHAEIQGENAEVSFNGINLLADDQLGDTTIVIEHQAPHCRSNQFYRTLLDDKARGVFQGKVHVHKVAQKTDGYQLSNALLLSPKAEMDTKPELEIYADDVKCSHGATTGQLDEEPLFYLRQRGLSEAQARFLLVESFVQEVVDHINDERVRDEVSEVTGAWLGKTLKI